jgi:serine/threonine-protein kinase
MASPGSERVSAERWQRIQTLFYAAADLPADERLRYLREQCNGDTDLYHHVEGLLDASDQPDDLLHGEVAAAASRVLATPEVAAGDRIGPYRIVKELGRGGMGSVYLANRADQEFEKQVAIKVARAGFLTEESLKRFRAERQILARLEHEHIARLLDGGSTSGVPYVVMEYVDGLPITAYCKEKNLSLRERLALFGNVCSGVQSAHQNLVVHRDLKPANILVTHDGVVKLVDFGIAKLLDPESETEALTQPFDRILTPEYASPEQVRGEPITTASDVYSLGVVLYELLSGESPYRFTTRRPAEIETVVCTQTPQAPSEKCGNRKLAGDLDNIVLLAMRKEPARRYASVADLSEDIRRYLEGYPVVARQEGWAYRASKFVRRNALAVGLSAVLLVALTGFGVTMAVLAKRLAVERDSAQEVSDFLVKIFERADTGETRGAAVTAREVLDEGVQHIEHELPSQPGLQANLFSAVGKVYQNLGMIKRSQETYEKSLQIRKSDPNASELELARSLKEVAEIRRVQRDFKGAEPLILQSLAIRERRVGKDDPLYSEALNTLGMIKQDSGDYKSAEPILRQALEINRRKLGNDHLQTAISIGNLGGLLHNRGQQKEAESLLREGLAIRRSMHGDLHWRTALSMRRLARLLAEIGKFSETEALLTESLAINRKLFGEVHPEVANNLSALASVLQDQKKFDEARGLYQQAIQLETKLRPGSVDLALVMNNLASLEEDVHRDAAAEELYRQSLAIRKAKLGAKHPAVARVQHNLGQLLTGMGKFKEARAMLTECMDIRREVYGAAHFQTAEAQILRARVMELQGDREAEKEYAAGFSVIRKALPKGHLRLESAERKYAQQHGGKAAPGIEDLK